MTHLHRFLEARLFLLFFGGVLFVIPSYFLGPQENLRPKGLGLARSLRCPWVRGECGWRSRWSQDLGASWPGVFCAVWGPLILGPLDFFLFYFLGPHLSGLNWGVRRILRTIAFIAEMLAVRKACRIYRSRVNMCFQMET